MPPTRSTALGQSRTGQGAGLRKGSCPVRPEPWTQRQQQGGSTCSFHTRTGQALGGSESGVETRTATQGSPALNKKSRGSCRRLQAHRRDTCLPGSYQDRGPSRRGEAPRPASHNQERADIVGTAGFCKTLLSCQPRPGPACPLPWHSSGQGAALPASIDEEHSQVFLKYPARKDISVINFYSPIFSGTCNRSKSQFPTSRMVRKTSFRKRRERFRSLEISMPQLLCPGREQSPSVGQLGRSS